MDTCVEKDRYNYNHHGNRPYFKGVDGVVCEQSGQIISGRIYILHSAVCILHQMSGRIVYSTHLQT